MSKSVRTPPTLQQQAPVPVYNEKGELQYYRPGNTGLAPSGTGAHLDASYFKYSSNRGVHLNEDIDYQRATHQGGWAKTGRFLANLASNIPAMVVDTVGQVVNLATEWGTDRDYQNGLTMLAAQMKDWGGNTTIYQRSPGELVDFSDPGWWLNTANGLASSAVGFAIGGAGISRLFLGGAKLIGNAARTQWIYNLSKLAAQGASAAVLSHAEGGMEAARVYDTVYDKLFNQYLAEGRSPAEADRQAKYFASQGAASTAQLNTMLNTGLNLMSLSPFFHGEKALARKAAAGMRQQAGEATETALARIAGTAYENTDLGKIMLRQGKYALAYESLQEGVEELNNQFASRSGEELGLSQQAKGVVEQLGELERWFARTMDGEGLLSFSLGLIGGVSQTALMDRIPFHRVAKEDSATGRPMTEKDAQGNERVVYHRVSSRALDELGQKKKFESVRDALVEDLTFYKNKQAELQTAIKDGKPKGEVDKIRAEILQPLHRRYVQLGLGSALVNTYKNIERLDADTPIEQARAAELAQLKASQDPGDQAAAVDLENRITQNLGKSEAQIQGYADYLGDNSFKEKAKEARDLVETHERLYRQVEKKYGWLQDAAETDLVPYLTNLMMNQELRRRHVRQESEEIAGEERQLREDFLRDPAVYGEDKHLMENRAHYQQKLADAQTRFTELGEDLRLLREAQLLHRNHGNLKGYEPLVRKYGLAGAIPEEVTRSMQTLATDLQKLRAQAQEDYKLADQGFAAVAGYSQWQAENPGKSLEDFSAHWHKKLDRNLANRLDALAARKAALSYLKVQTEQSQRRLDDMLQPEQAEKFIQKALKHDLAQQEEAQIELAQREFQAQYANSARTAFSRVQKAHHSLVLKRAAEHVVTAETRLSGLKTALKDKQSQHAAATGTAANALQLDIVALEHQVKTEEEHVTYLRAYHDHLAGLEPLVALEAEEAEAPVPPSAAPNLAPDDTAEGEGADEAVETETEAPVVLTLAERLEQSYPGQVDILQTYLDGLLVFNQAQLPTEAVFQLWINGVPALLSAPKVLSADEVEDLRELVAERTQAVAAQAEELRLQTLQTYLTAFNPEDAAFLTDTILALRAGTPVELLDQQGFAERGIAHMWDVVVRLHAPAVAAYPAELESLLQLSAQDLYGHRELLLKHLPPHVAGAFIRSQDRAGFLTNFFSGKPVATGLVVEATGALPAPGIHKYSPIFTDSAFKVDGWQSIQISPSGTLTMQVGEDGQVWLHEELQLMDSLLEEKLPPLPFGAIQNMIRPEDLQASAHELARVQHDEHDKVTDAFAIATNTLAYDEVLHGTTFERVSRSAYLDKRANKRVLLSEVLQPGTEVVLELDEAYEGPQRIDYEFGVKDRKVTFADYLEEGQIPLTTYAVGNIPIVIKDAQTGEVYGYLHRADWVSSKYPDTDNYRNLAGDPQAVELQRARILKIRQQLAEQWNAGIRTGMQVKVKQKNPGKVILNMEKGKQGKKPKVVWRPAVQMLPDQNLLLAIGVGETVYTTKNRSMDVGNSKGAQWGNTALVLLPMSDGSYHASPLYSNTLSADKDVPMLLYALELFKRYQAGLQQTDLEKKHLDTLQAETGFDLRTVKGLRSFIKQYYTYLQSFDAGKTAIRAEAAPGEDRQQRFLFNITDNGTIMVGTSYSGMATVFGDLTVAGTLTRQFVDTFTAGITQRPKSLAFTDTAEGVRGLNHHIMGNDWKPLRVPQLSKGKLSFREFASYNEYAKTFTQTMVYGKHQVEGRHVYTANPTVVLEYPLEEPTYQPRPPREDEKDWPAPLPPVATEEEQWDEEPDDSVGGLFGTTREMRTLPGLPATAENLADLRTFTPDAARSVGAVQQELTQLRSGVVAPEHIPFIKCK